jgi:hypothetical protein
MISSRSDVKFREGFVPSDSYYSNELHVSPGLSPQEPVLELRPGREMAASISLSGNRLSVGREIVRLFLYGFVIMIIGGAAFASQYGDDNTREVLGILQSALRGFSPDLGAYQSARVSERVSTRSDQAATEQASAKEARSSQFPPIVAGAGGPSQIQQQLETIASQLAAVKGLAEQLAVSQKKMAEDVAALEPAKENGGQKVWWLYQTSAFSAAPHKSPKKSAPSDAKTGVTAGPRPQTP